MEEEITRQFELAKLDYSRLGTQEQDLMNKRREVWNMFFAQATYLNPHDRRA